MSLKQILDTWAQNLAEKAKLNVTDLHESTEAFKAVAGYYATTQKNRKVKAPEPEDEEPGGFSFGREPGAENGGTSSQVPGRRDS